MEKYFFIFQVTYFDDLDEDLRKDKGIVIGESTVKAIEKISDFYGEKSIEYISIKYFNTDLPDIIIEEDFPNTVKAAFKENPTY